ncbi:hypothetical protein DSO57_1038777 [Entomophthora muscae]|uniref:Uncharacterized protein n=1 Tax=Entomophthora muscae TaxID=34485 RepID=A0ACC2RPM2_9FUNG|nr:hypothetical protein DSO57_1038777 [Entomophthora muscae]
MGLLMYYYTKPPVTSLYHVWASQKVVLFPLLLLFLLCCDCIYQSGEEFNYETPLQGFFFVTSDKLLSTMITKRPQPWESNPGLSQAASPQGQPPSRPQFSGFKSGLDLTSENPLKFDEPSLPTMMPPALGVPVNPTNQQAGLATDPRITWATTEEETKIPSIRNVLPRDDLSCDLVKELECSSCKSANEITPAIVATKGCEDLVDGETRAMKIFESFALTDGHTYTLGHQEDAHCHPYNKVT